VTASATAADRRVRALRPAKPLVDPWRAHGSVVDVERRPDGTVEQALTVFLAGAECPFTCSFCDLWRWTIDGPTPPGALPRQLHEALARRDLPRPRRLKLYNASNFFDARAVPPSDWPAIAELAASFDGVTVESHASTVGARVLEFARALDGRLEVAMGLETTHPDATAHLNKRMTPARFAEATAFLVANGVDVRAFVLLGAPHVAPNESAEWTVRTAEFAVSAGASVVALIPVRGGNGELERLAATGEFTPPTLRQLETALDRCLRLAPAVVTADLWDAERFSACGACRDARIERLARINRSGAPEPAVRCVECDA